MLHSKGSVNILTDEGAISIDTLIKDVIVTPLDRNSWTDSLKSPQATSLQLDGDFSQTQFPIHILIGLDGLWRFLKPDLIYGYPTDQALTLAYLISGRLFPTTDSTNHSQRALQCIAAGHSLESSHSMTVNGTATLVQRILRYTAKLQISLKLKHKE